VRAPGWRTGVVLGARRGDGRGPGAGHREHRLSDRSVTKTFTAIAGMQLRDQSPVDLGTPANEYLPAFRLVLARPGLLPATVRHLLTHTAAVGFWRRLSDLLQREFVPACGPDAMRRRRFADYYRQGLPVEVEPGTKWV
jgi:CubicO group peptidase (beta-lactamase class C family)